MSKDELLKRISKAAQITWDTIGGDILRCLEECGELPEIDRDQVVEEVIMYIDMQGQDIDAAHEFLKLDIKEQRKILRGIFRAPYYGW